MSVRIATGSRIHNLGQPYDKAIMSAYKQSGIDCVRELNGSFALVIQDGGTTYLVGDRYGTKPIYYSTQGGRLRLRRHIKDLIEEIRSPPSIDMAALHEYFTFQNILSDRTLFAGIKMLPSGCIGIWHNKELEIRRYWDYKFEGNGDPVKDSSPSRIRELLTQAVSRQTNNGKPPFGIYISGGMDSAAIVCLAAREYDRIPTFTCGFDVREADKAEAEFDERKYAEDLAHSLRCRNYQAVLGPECLPRAMPGLTESLEEPRIGQSYPDYYAADLAKRFVGRVLSGAGGDEFFGGYPWHYGHATDAESYYRFYSRLIKDEDKPSFFLPFAYNRMTGNPAREAFMQLWDRGGSSNSSKCQYVDVNSSLRGLLTITDKIVSSVGLEIGYPLLDNDLVDCVTPMPLEQKCQHDTGKLALRESLRDIVPEVILQRKKQGFAAPDSAWYREPLRPYLNELICREDAWIYSYLNHSYVIDRINQHYRGEANYRALLWSLVSFEWWLRKFNAGGPA